MRKGFDADQNIGPLAAKIVANEYYFVGRYLKNLLAAEVSQLSDAGLLIVSIHERRGDPSSFSASQGTVDGQLATRQARMLGQPAGSVIVSAIDFDAQPNHLPTIVAYFGSYREALAIGGYRAGAYGNGLALGTLLDHKLIEIAYLAGSMGWTGSHAFDDAKRWHIRQHPTILGRTPTPVMHGGLGIAIDPCDAIDGDFGGWSLTAAKPGTATAPTTAPDPVRSAAQTFTAAALALQTELKTARLYAGALDGDWGPASRAALLKWKAKP